MAQPILVGFIFAGQTRDPLSGPHCIMIHEIYKNCL